MSMYRSTARLDRNRAVQAARREGRTLRSLGDEYGVTPERIRQVLDKMRCFDLRETERRGSS